MTAFATAAEAFAAALRDDDAEQLYERAPCGYLSTTPDGEVVKVNQTLLTWTGYERDALLGRRITELLTGGGRIYFETHYAPMLRMQGAVREIALDLVCADGRRLPVLLNSVLEYADGGAPRVVRTAVFDATERREYERELLRAKKKAEESEAHARALSRTLQETLIPPLPPDVPGLDLAAAYRPAGDGDEVGGDFYDVFEIGDGAWVVAIGDVCGKGPEAAVVTALARYAIRAEAVRISSPAAVLATVNEVLLAHRTDRFCTAALLWLRRVDGGWEVTMSSAGHPPPLVVPAEGEPRAIATSGSLLGVLAAPRLTDTTLTLCGGDALVGFTDGVTDARRGEEFFGDDGLRASVQRHRGSTVENLVLGVVDDVLAFQHQRPRDDVAVVAIRVPAS